MPSLKTRFFLILLTTGGLFIAAALSGQTTISKIRVSEEFANIRSQPDIRSPVLFQVARNTILNAIKKEGEWFLVSWKDEDGIERTGYIHESLVVVMPSEEEAAEAKKETGLTQKKEVTQQAATSPEKKQPELRPGEEKRPPAVTEKEAAGPKKAPFHLKLAPGAEFFALSQVNDAASGLAGFMADVWGEKETPSVTSFHWAPAASFEIGIPVRRGLAFQLSLSGVSGQQENVLGFSGKAANPSILIRSKLQTIPLSLLLNYEFLPFLAVALGPEVTAVEYRYTYRLSQENYLEEWSGKATAIAMGLRAKLTFTTWWLSRIGFYLEAGGRLEEVSGLKGKDTHLLPGGQSFEEEGKLYFFLVRSYGDRRYPVLFIRAKRPSEAGVEQPQEASFNLNGFSLRLGLVFRF